MGNRKSKIDGKINDVPQKSEPTHVPTILNEVQTVQPLLDQLTIGDRTYVYSHDDEIGAGSFGIVYRGIQMNNDRDVAIKRLTTKDQSGDMKIHSNEITVVKKMRGLGRKYLVAIFDIVVETRRTYIIMELVSDGNLKDFLSLNSAFKPYQTWQLARHMTFALIELNSIKIIHRDIKPDNILVTRDQTGILSFKMADFGVSRFLNTQSFASTLTGTPGYYAPEALTDKYDNKCDVFSLGVVLLECATGKYPFKEVTPRSYALECSTKKFSLIISAAIKNLTCEELKAFLRPMLEYDVSNRVSVKGLHDKIVFLPKQRKQMKRKLYFSSNDDAVLIRIFYYTGFRDRVNFERVNKKFRDLLQCVWLAQEVLRFGKNHKFDWFECCVDVQHRNRNCDQATLACDLKSFIAFNQLLRYCVNLKCLRFVADGSGSVLDLSFLPMNIEHLVIITSNATIASNFHRPNLRCLELRKMSSRNDDKISNFIKKHVNSLNFVTFPLLYNIPIDKRILNEIKHLQHFEGYMTEDEYMTFTNKQNLIQFFAGTFDVEFDEFPSLRRIQIGEFNEDYVMSKYAKQAFDINLFNPRLNLYVKLEENLHNLCSLLVAANNADIFFTEKFKLLKLKTCYIRTSQTNLGSYTITDLVTRFPKMRNFALHFDCKVVPTTRFDSKQWSEYAKLCPKRKITVAHIGVLPIYSENQPSNLHVHQWSNLTANVTEI